MRPKKTASVNSNHGSVKRHPSSVGRYARYHACVPDSHSLVPEWRLLKRRQFAARDVNFALRHLRSALATTRPRVASELGRRDRSLAYDSATNARTALRSCGATSANNDRYRERSGPTNDSHDRRNSRKKSMSGGDLYPSAPAICLTSRSASSEETCAPIEDIRTSSATAQFLRLGRLLTSSCARRTEYVANPWRVAANMGASLFG